MRSLKGRGAGWLSYKSNCFLRTLPGHHAHRKRHQTTANYLKSSRTKPRKCAASVKRWNGAFDFCHPQDTTQDTISFSSFSHWDPPNASGRPFVRPPCICIPIVEKYGFCGSYHNKCHITSFVNTWMCHSPYNNSYLSTTAYTKIEKKSQGYFHVLSLFISNNRQQ